MDLGIFGLHGLGSWESAWNSNGIGWDQRFCMCLLGHRMGMDDDLL